MQIEIITFFNLVIAVKALTILKPTFFNIFKHFFDKQFDFTYFLENKNILYIILNIYYKNIYYTTKTLRIEFGLF